MRKRKVYYLGIALIALAALSIGPVTVAQAQSNHLEFIDDYPDASFEELQQLIEAYYADKDKGRGSGYKQWKRWELQHGPRMAIQGKVNIQRRLLEAEREVRERHGTRAANGAWSFFGGTLHKRVGSGHNGGVGRVNCLGFHPTDPNTFYVGLPGGGCFRTTDHGNSWTSITDGLPLLGVSGIAVDHVNPDIIYLLTGDGDGAHTYSIGVIKSFDGGDTWYETGLQFTVNEYKRNYKLRMHPTDRNTLFVVGSDGIYRTTDAGSNWTLVTSGLFSEARDLEFKPGDPMTVYATTTGQFWRSVNGGSTWTQITTGLASSASRVECAVSPADPAAVYLIYGGGSGLIGIYRSLNSGLSFGLQANSPNLLGYETDGSDGSSQAWYDLAIAVNESNASNLFIGGINVWRSVTSGSSWINSSYWLEYAAAQYTHADIHWLEYRNGNLYCGSDGGVYLSTDNALTWSSLTEGLPITQFYRIATTPQNSALVYGGAQDNGTNRVVSGNDTIYHIEGADGMDCMIDYNNQNIVYGSVQGGALFKSVDGGNSISFIYPAYGAWVTPYAMHTSNSNVILGGWSSTYFSDNGGSSWNNIGSPLGYADFLITCPSHATRAYIADWNAIYRTDNYLIYGGAASWTNIGAGLPLGSAYIGGIETSSTQSGNVFACFSGFAAGEKVYESNDAGATWTNISGTLPNVPVNCLAYDPNTGGLYAGTDIGVFYRDDAIGDWIPFRNWMPAVQVRDLEFNALNNQLKAGTFGRGIWKTSGYSPCVSSYSFPSGFEDIGFKFYEAADSISSPRRVVGGLGTDVRYKAGIQVRLVDGFEVTAGSGFQAEIGPCIAADFVPDVNPMRGILVGKLADEPEAGIFEPEAALSGVTLYPNPADESAILEFEIADALETVIYISDLSGRVIAEQSSRTYLAGQNRVDIPAATLAPGTYLVHLYCGTDREVLKLVVAR